MQDYLNEYIVLCEDTCKNIISEIISLHEDDMKIKYYIDEYKIICDRTAENIIVNATNDKDKYIKHITLKDITVD